jgi:hypothetical protein
MMLSFSRFEAQDAASPLYGEVCGDEARMALRYTLTASGFPVRVNTMPLVFIPGANK